MRNVTKKHKISTFEGEPFAYGTAVDENIFQVQNMEHKYNQCELMGLSYYYPKTLKLPRLAGRCLGGYFNLNSGSIGWDASQIML